MKEQHAIDCLNERAGATFSEAMDWQSRVRSAIDAIIAERLLPHFRTEFNSRLSDDYATRRDVTTWANQVLYEAGLCLTLESDGRPCSLHLTRSSPTNSGRIYLETFACDGRRDRLLNVSSANDLVLRPLPVGSRSRGRTDPTRN